MTTADSLQRKPSIDDEIAAFDAQISALEAQLRPLIKARGKLRQRRSMMQAWADAVAHAMRTATNKRAAQPAEVRARKSVGTKKSWADPVIRARRCAGLADPEVKARKVAAYIATCAVRGADVNDDGPARKRRKEPHVPKLRDSLEVRIFGAV